MYNGPSKLNIWVISCCLSHMREVIIFSPYFIPSPYFVCAYSNDSEEIAHLCRLDQAFAARLYTCSMT